MSYSKQKFVDRVKNGSGEVVVEGTTLRAEHLNHMEEGIYEAMHTAEGAVSNREVTAGELTEIWALLNELHNQCESVQSWPVLKTGLDWLEGSGFEYVSARAPITEIHFVKEYTPTGSETVFDPAASGSITGYRNGTVITICTNGADKIRLNDNCANIFALMPNMKKLCGLELIDASSVVNFAGGFYNNGIEELDISYWHLERMTSCAGMFNLCRNLKKVKFSKYGLPAIKSKVDAEGVMVISSGANSMFMECTELVEVDLGRGLTEVGLQMFKKCLKLETINGLSSVASIGEQAFTYTPNLKYVDINPDLIQGIGDNACRLSSIEDSVDLSVVDLSLVGTMATRHKRWSAEVLSDIRKASLPTVYMDVPNHENQDNYPDVNFCYAQKPGDTEAKWHSVADGGCSSLAIYHEWQAHYAGTSKEYASYGDWWAWFNEQYSAKNDGAVFAEDNTMSGEYPDEAIIETIGWTRTGVQYVVGADQLKKVAERLSANKATYVSMNSANIPGYHAVLIIGADAATGKIALLDSHVTGTTGTIAWLRFEDIFVGGGSDDESYDKIAMHEYN